MPIKPVYAIILLFTLFSQPALAAAPTDTLTVPVREFTHTEYPEDPADRSVHHQKYDGRKLTLIRKDATHFDFVFEPTPGHAEIAKVVFKNIDVSLMTPNLPEWTKADPGLTRIALTDRQWNRQQVAFPMSSIEISGGDGFESSNLFSAELAKNCLNAGLWEVLLFTKEDGQKKLYYQGWFTFPANEYKRLFEQNTGLQFSEHSNYLKHWSDPAGTPIALEKLRTVLSEKKVAATYDANERILASGEQARKRRTLNAPNIIKWGDLYSDQRTIRFATFIKPGVYTMRDLWKNEYAEMAQYDSTTLRQIRSSAPKQANQDLYELEVAFRNRAGTKPRKFIVSGIQIDKLPQLAINDYGKGMYMPMGIGVPPFYQSYDNLLALPPQESAYFSVLLDENNRWIDHHKSAIDGPVLHRDASDPTKLHLYLLSYERHSLILHLVISTTQPAIQSAANN